MFSQISSVHSLFCATAGDFDSNTAESCEIVTLTILRQLTGKQQFQMHWPLSKGKNNLYQGMRQNKKNSWTFACLVVEAYLYGAASAWSSLWIIRWVDIRFVTHVWFFRRGIMDFYCTADLLPSSLPSLSLAKTRSNISKAALAFRQFFILSNFIFLVFS